MHSVKRWIRNEIEGAQDALKVIEVFEQQVVRKDDRIFELEKKISELEAEVAKPGEIMADAVNVVEGKKKMPDGHYRQTITKKADFSYVHKRQS